MVCGSSDNSTRDRDKEEEGEREGGKEAGRERRRLSNKCGILGVGHELSRCLPLEHFSPDYHYLNVKKLTNPITNANRDPRRNPKLISLAT